MKLFNIALLLATLASVRSINTLKFILLPGVTMTDPTGTATVLEGPASFELPIGAIFTPFDRKVKASSKDGYKDYSCKYSPKTGNALAAGQSATLVHQVLKDLVLDVGGDGLVTITCT
ncbi:uncharacterized protein MKK02DRAFT_28001 [Dioszegia hungarica]|uniref:Uncharacterized protein n=1 Tax=Dioszegia hungarica TaxID=4972 RepID=A0AA38H911_9TREE|nr:uncharacterized protein MKK02DRAFT_28001 [Dioszegia hungarica]KAI9634871.1 hypothetical protein MKK02DRAFT_28001 [Dioszegia hungarica]